MLTQATEAAFTSDGLDVAFIAGGDLWVMDTELREPRQITATAELEAHPVFSPDGQTLLFVADREARSDVYRAVRTDPKKHWWQNDKFKIERVTTDGEVKSALRFSPDGTKISYLRGRGDLWIADANGYPVEDASALFALVDQLGPSLGLARPLPGGDPPHVQLGGDWQEAAAKLREQRLQVAPEAAQQAASER